MRDILPPPHDRSGSVREHACLHHLVSVMYGPIMSTDPHVTIRRCTVPEILDVRWEALRAPRPRETAHLTFDDAPETRHWCAVVSDHVVGSVSVMAAELPEPDWPHHRSYGWQLRGMAVAASHRGTGVGGLLLRHVMSEIPSGLWCNARVTALGFYERHTWEIIGVPFDVPLVGPHRRMVVPA